MALPSRRIHYQVEGLRPICEKDAAGAENKNLTTKRHEGSTQDFADGAFVIPWCPSWLLLILLTPPNSRGLPHSEA
jgi:hypothetical protein